MLWCESLGSMCLVGGVVCADSESVVTVNSSINIIFLIVCEFYVTFSGAKVAAFAQWRNRHCAVNSSVAYPYIRGLGEY